MYYGKTLYNFCFCCCWWWSHDPISLSPLIGNFSHNAKATHHHTPCTCDLDLIEVLLRVSLLSPRLSRLPLLIPMGVERVTAAADLMPIPYVATEEYHPNSITCLVVLLLLQSAYRLSRKLVAQIPSTKLILEFKNRRRNSCDLCDKNTKH